MKNYKAGLVMLLVFFFAIPGGAANITLDDLNIHGFVSQGFLYTTHDMVFLTDDSDDGTFEFNEMAVNFSADPTNNLSLGMQLNAFDMGDNGNDEVGVDWAFGDYSLRGYLGFRAGIMKIPFGLYSEVRKIDMVRTSVLLPTSVYPEWLREAFARMKGACLYGNLPGNISYQAMYGKVDVKSDGGLADGLSDILSGLGMDVTDTDTNFAYAGKLQWDSPFGLKLAASIYGVDGLEMDMGRTLDLPAMVTGGLAGLTSPMTGLLACEPISIWALSAEYIKDRLTIAAEYTEYDFEFTVNISTNLDPAIVVAMQIPPQVGKKTTLQGYYGGISYRVLDPLEIGTYYSVLYFDKTDRNGVEYEQTFGLPDYDAWLKEICLSVRYDFSSSWCGKIEAHLMDGAFMAPGAETDDWALYAAKVTYSF